MLLVASLVTAVWILRKIRKNRVKQEDALFWLCFAFMLALFGIFPKLSYMMAEILGIQSPANFVFLAVIGFWEEQELERPKPPERSEWRVCVDTGEEPEKCIVEGWTIRRVEERKITLKPRSVDRKSVV